jgi:hypothetical protein
LSCRFKNGGVKKHGKIKVRKEVRNVFDLSRLLLKLLNQQGRAQ